jgi:hypothetical protein
LAYESSEIPRDVKQIGNKLYNEWKKNKISRDFIYNLYEIGVNLDPFVLELKLLPELQIIFGKIFKNIIAISYILRKISIQAMKKF